MFKNYIKILLRNLFAQKIFTLINVFGLAIGMTACLILMKYVDYETSYEKFNKNIDNSYRITLKKFQNGELQTHSTRTYPGLFYLLEKDIPEIKYVSRMYPEDCLFRLGDKVISEQETYWVDNDFLKMFDVQMIKGSAENALVNSYSLVISESAAKRFFGNGEAVGKTINLNQSVPFLITGVFKDYPENSHFSFDYLLNFHTIGVLDGMEVINNLKYNWVCTYITIDDNANLQNLERKFSDIINRDFSYLKEENTKIIFEPQPVTDIHLKSNLNQEFSANGDIDSIYFLILISVITVLIAWINFINLSAARALERAKETGVRKVLGAVKSQIIQQFILESTTLNFLSLLIAIIFVEIVTPLLFPLIGIYLPQSSSSNLFLWLIIFISFLICGLLAGLYPAFLLSSYKPSEVLKGKFRNSVKGSFIKNGLVVFQFTAAIILIIGLFTIQSQLMFMREKSLGFKPEQVVVIKSPRSMIESPKTVGNFRKFENLLSEIPGVKTLSAANYIPGHEVFAQADNFVGQGSDLEPATLTVLNIEEDYFDLLGVELIAGRFYIKDHPADEGAIILNETAARNFGFTSPEQSINGIITNRAGDLQLKIIGVVKDYHQQHLKKPIEPMIYFKSFRYQFGYYPVKVSSENIYETIEQVKQKWSEVYPIDPFDYFFLDEYFNIQYKADRQFSAAFGLFTFLAIVIASLGLFGLSYFSAIQKTKEIGVRKVVGATIPNIILMLSGKFIKLIVIANFIAIPIAFYFMNKWLQEFAYRTNLKWQVFLIAGGIALVIAFITMSFHAFKAARKNPVESLRYE